jgi:hypothetical protein
MRSRRSRLEVACRVGAFALLGWLLGASLSPPTRLRVAQARDADVASALHEWTRDPANVVLHATFDSAPSPWVVDWLAALRHSRHAVSWSGPLAAIALSVQPAADPRGGVRIDVAAPLHARVVVRDDAGPIDTLTVASLGGSVTTPLVVGAVHADVGRVTASAPAPDSAIVKPVLVVGMAGWEGKFVAAALAERGWRVASRFAVAPGVGVDRGGALALDTANYAAIVAIDSTVQSLAPALVRYVRMGGGLVLAGNAARAVAFASISPGALGNRFRPAVPAANAASMPATLGATGYYPVARLAPDAVAIDRVGGAVVTAARRVDAGRVLLVGFDDSWRWRLAGDARAASAHREWWSRAVSAVAYAPAAARVEVPRSSAPVAELAGAVGLTRALDPALARSGLDVRLPLVILILILLCTEWASRRLRGRR